MADRSEPRPFHSFLLGVGLDNKDGHTRVTRGDHFHLVGGSEKTHHKMQDKMMEVTEELAREGREIKDIGPEDFEKISEIMRS